MVSSKSFSRCNFSAILPNSKHANNNWELVGVDCCNLDFSEDGFRFAGDGAVNGLDLDCFMDAGCFFPLFPELDRPEGEGGGSCLCWEEGGREGSWDWLLMEEVRKE